jgi:uncharacterized protein
VGTFGVKNYPDAAINSSERGSALFGRSQFQRRTLMAHSLFINAEALASICRRYRIRRLSLFGSTLKGINRPDSDVDLLVEFEQDAKPSLLTIARIEIELSPLVGGRKVDLRTAQDLSRYFRDEVVQSAELQYEAR